MAKCDKCGEEYPDGSEHVCSAPEEKVEEENAAEEMTEKSDDNASEENKGNSTE
ncbi:MAG: hypothetical protein Q8R37_00750 [Nanoarchaeota archaeon]|nr:hypothetical protein [Nanoarchaeota archaeon]